MKLFTIFFLIYVACLTQGYAIQGAASQGGAGPKGALGAHGAAPQREAFISPWLTGPLLSSGYAAVPKGQFEIEPYIFEIIYTGFYDKHWKAHSLDNFYQTLVQIPFWIGIAPNADINITPQFYYNASQGASDSGFGDLSLSLDWQIITDHPEKKWLPQLKISATQTFPTGKYQKLNPKKHLTDSFGLGTYATIFTLTLGKIFHLHGVHYMSSILTFSDVISTPVHVKGLSAYRGGPATKGKIYPGNNFRIIYGTEFTLTRNWALATDLMANFYAKTRFKGCTEDAAGFPSSAQFTLSPAIEYNWNFNLGLILGSWFTFAGRNDNRFASAVAATTFFYFF